MNTDKLFLVAGLLLMFLVSVTAFGGQEDAGVGADASAEVDRADRGFMGNVQLHCADHGISMCEDDLRFYHLVYAGPHYLLWG